MQHYESDCPTGLVTKSRKYSPDAPIEWGIQARWILLFGAASWLIPIAIWVALA